MISSFNGLILKNTDQGGEKVRGEHHQGRVLCVQLLGSVLAGIYDPQGYPVHLTEEQPEVPGAKELSQGCSQLKETTPSFQRRSTWF